MNSTGQNGEKMRYRIILLLVVGLTAFSSAMKELNQFQQFTLDASRLMAQLSAQIVPVQVTQTAEIPQTAVKLESCDSKQSPPTIDLPWLDQDKRPGAVVPRPSQIIDVAKVERPAQRARAAASVEIAKVKKLPQIDFDHPVAFEFRIPSDQDTDPDNLVTPEFSWTMFKAKSRKHGAIRITPRDREMLLKTLNRSINLRSAS